MQELPPELLDQLRQHSTCTVANAIESLEVRLRNEGYSDGTVKLLTDVPQPAVGYAATVKIRCSSPPQVGPTYVERTQWWDYILSIPSPRFVVIEDVDPQPGAAAFIGEVHTNILKALGCVAVATNGAVRDLSEIEALAFPIFAGNSAVSHGYAHIVEIDTAVQLGGLKIAPGDLIQADSHGLLLIPKERAAELPQVISGMIAIEQEIISLCQTSPFSLDALREAIRHLRSLII